MLATEKRPRQLHWYHAGPMLFGDWGTSRLYVLGICFYHTRQASLWFMLAMSVLLVGVGWAYSIICRLYPDGGGVYSSARHKSQLVAIIGALLLCADYVVTAALSALDAFHYLDVPMPHVFAAAGIGLVGVINIFGPTKSGLFAGFAAILTVIGTAVIAGFAAPYLGQARVTEPVGNPGSWWGQFTAIILAISGVEAIANMTGIMVEPVEKTARKAIWPVLIEIVVLNLILTLAMTAIPLEVLGDGDPSKAYDLHRDDMLRVMAAYYVSPVFAMVASVVFALLLMSAVNTAVTDLVSIQYMMAHDRELPQFFTRLNAYGMPYWPLLLGVGVPLVTVILAPDVGHLADLYAIGVVGAVAVNLGSCAVSFDLPIKRWERVGITALAVLMTGIWVSIAYEKPHALMFAGSIVCVGLVARAVTKRWSAAAVAAPSKGEIVEPAVPTYTPTTRFLAATRGNLKLIDFAIDQAKRHQAELLVLFTRQIAVNMLGPANQPKLIHDAEAQQLFGELARRANAAGVPVRPLYSVATDVAEVILDFAATYGVERVILGATQRGSLWRTMKGDVIQGVAAHLPEKTQLLICA